MAKIALTGAITAGAAYLAKRLIQKNYGDYIAFKGLCQKIIQRLEEEHHNKDTTICLCEIFSQVDLESKDGLFMKLITFKIHENYYNHPENSDCFMPPFSEGIFLMNLSKTHSIVYNKYPVFKDHLLVITRSFEN